MRKTIPTLGVVSAGLLLAGSPAQAIETDMLSAINVGIANGIQANLPIQVPVNICGNAIALLGTASASCTGTGATANYPATGGGSSGQGDSDMLSAINVGIANGIQADALVQVPVNVCGNAISVLATTTAACTSTGATANAFTDVHNHNGNGNQNGIYPRTIVPSKALPSVTPAKAKAKPLPSKIRVSAAKPRKTEVGLLTNLLRPVTGLLGGGERNNGNHNGYNGGGNGDRSCGNVNMTTLGNVGIANGIQVHAPIQIPINFSGNAIALGGSATASSTGGATANYC